MTGQGADKPPVDNPITSSDQDVLKRAPIADSFAAEVRRLDASEGIVVAVLGRWGHGKSSFINLMREHFAATPPLVVVDFNPWLFSGTQQLVDFFFTELASSLQLKDKDEFQTIAKALRDYGDVLSPLGAIPVFGAWWERSYKATRAFTEWLRQRREKNAGSLRDQVADALRALDEPIVVVVDDIDRLTTAEIRDVFRLVRLTASFPNLIYVLAFDRARVEAALDEDGVPGRAYLEKIIQLGFDLPSIPAPLLRTHVFAELDRLVGDVGDIRFDRSRWADVYVETVEPLIASIRDVTRLALSARPVMAALGSDVEAVDLIAIESIRVFRPELFDALQRIRSDLTTTTGGLYGQQRDDRAQSRMEEILKLAGNDGAVVRSLIKRVFPAAERLIGGTHYMSDYQGIWRKAHRLAHSDFLDLYLDRVAPAGLDAFGNAERAFELLADPSVLDKFLVSLNPDILGDTIAALEAYEGEFPADGIVPGATALLNHIADIPERDGGLFDLRRDIVVTRVVLRMLRQIEDDSKRETAVRRILAGVESRSSEYELILLVGHLEHAGSKLVSETTATDLEQALAREVEASPPARIEREWALLRVYTFVKDRGANLDRAGVTEPNVVRALLADARGENRSQSMDSRHVRREQALAWDSLVEIFGGEDALRPAVEALRDADGDSDLVILAQRYLSGWRPSRH